jgi:prevent-host-death family protein
MQAASISELKTSASEYLLKVKAGEEILLTDRGNPFAKIIRIRRSELPADVHMAQLEQRGLASVGKMSLPADFLSSPRPHDRDGLALKALFEEREEGR